MSNGGVKGKTNTPTSSIANGVWSIQDAYRNELVGIWPKTPISPASLFGVGDFGAFYDFSDTSTLWQDTGATTPVTTTGQNIYRADDLSGNGNNLTATNAPTWDSGGYSVYNGSTSYLITTISHTVTDFTIIIGSEETVRKDHLTYSLANGEPATGRLQAHIAWGNGNYYFDAYNYTTGRVSGAATVGVGTSVVATQKREGTANSVRTNGSAFGTPVSEGTSFTVNQIRLGSGNTDRYLNGKIYSFFFIDRALTLTETQLVEDWIAAKNGAY